MATSAQVQEYWLPGFSLSRNIVLSNIQYFLGPSATVRPYTYQGREGYLIVGTLITRQQIEDLQRLSKEHEKQAALRMSNRSSNNGSQSQEPYINEPIPVGPGRRSSPEYSYRRNR